MNDKPRLSQAEFTILDLLFEADKWPLSDVSHASFELMAKNRFREKKTRRLTNARKKN